MPALDMTLHMSVRVDEYHLQHENTDYVLTHYYTHSVADGEKMKAGDQTVSVKDSAGQLFALTTEGARKYPLTLFGADTAHTTENSQATLCTLIESGIELMAKRDQALRYPTIHPNPATTKAQPNLIAAMNIFVENKDERQKQHDKNVKNEWKKKQNAAKLP